MNAQELPGQRVLIFCLSAVIFFCAMAHGAHDLWAATAAYLGVLALTATIFVSSACRPDAPELNLKGIVPLIPLAAALALSSVFSVHPEESFVALMDWLCSLLVFFIAVNLFRTDQAATQFLAVLALVIGIEAGVNLFQRYEIHHMPGTYVVCAGTLVNGNIATAFLIGWAAPLWHMAREKRSLYWEAAFLVSLLAIALLASFWAALCLLAAAPFLIGIEKCSQWVLTHRRQALAAAAILAAGVAAILVWKFYCYQEIGRGVALSRIFWWMSGFKMFWDHPGLGVGIGNYPSAYLSYKMGQGQNTLYIHNFPLEILAESGLAGVAGAAVFFLWLKKQARLPSVRRSFLLGAMLMALYCSINVGMEYLVNLMIFWVFLGIALAPEIGAELWKPGFCGAGIAVALALAASPYVLSPFLASRDCVAGWALLKNGNFQEAQKAFQDASKIYGLSSEAQEGWATSLAMQYRVIGEKDLLNRAIEHQEKALSLDRRNGELFLRLRAYLSAAGQQQQAELALEQAAELGAFRASRP